LPIPEAIKKLEARVKLAEPPKIQVTPSWWGRMPYFRFRTTLFVETQK
jgi:hypothetical protein